MKSHSNFTPYSKIFRETHLLRNVREMYFRRDGWIQGNNLNIIDNDETIWNKNSDDEDDEESTFKGAIMADPIWNDKVGLPILGVPSNIIYKNTVDFDMSSFYPVIKIISNMDPSTLLYKAEIDNDQFISGEYQNRSLNVIYYEMDKNRKMRKLDITGEIVNIYVSNNILTFGYDFLGLPSITELYRDVMKQYNC